MKGSYDVIERMTEVVKKYGVEDLVELQASFCLGCCAQGVNVKVDEYGTAVAERVGDDNFVLHNVNRDNAEELFAREIFPLLNL